MKITKPPSSSLTQAATPNTAVQPSVAAAVPAPSKGWVPSARQSTVASARPAAATTAVRTAFDPKNLAGARSVDFAARLAGAAYLNEADFQKRAKSEFGFTEAKFFDSSTNAHCTDAQAGVGVVPGVGIFIAYRGSESTTDFLRDATAIRSKSDSYGGGHVHKGFRDQTEALFQDISSHVHATMKAHPELPVYFTGHSLGGAVARMAVSRVLTDMERGGGSGQIGGVYTFGGPAIGDETFERQWSKRLADHGGTYVRVRNEEDPVPLLPAINFRHLDEGVHDVHLLGPTGQVERKNDFGGGTGKRLLRLAGDVANVTDHLMQNYLTATGAWVASSN